MSKPPKKSEAELVRLLKKRYSPPAYAFLPQVRSQTGFSGDKSIRTADALAMSIYPSRGLTLHGFECKSSRSDWLAELKNPDKADAICRYCDYWWIVAADETVAFESEVPDTWGLLVAKGDMLVAAKSCARLSPCQMTREFLASLLRASAEYVVPKENIAAELNEKYQEGLERGKQQSETDVRVAKAELDKVRRCVAQFEAASGVKIDTWAGHNGKIGDAVRFVLESQVATSPTEPIGIV